MRQSSSYGAAAFEEPDHTNAPAAGVDAAPDDRIRFVRASKLRFARGGRIPLAVNRIPNRETGKMNQLGRAIGVTRTQHRRHLIRGIGCICLAVFFAAARVGDARSEDQATAESASHEQLSAQIQVAIQRAKPACVAVVRRRGPNVRTAFSAVIVSAEGHILTAGHCIDAGAAYDVILDDGRTLRAQALGRSAFLDCGLMKITEDAEFPHAEMGTSIGLGRNQPCLSISHPGGFDRDRGLVVRLGRVVSTNSRGHIHNTCLMEPGDSGGGLFDLEGRVIGIHAYIARDLDDNFDIPVDLFRTHWDQLCQSGEFTPPYAVPQFGIRLQSDQAMAGGVEVAEVLQASPAAEAGLLAGDVIASVNDTELTEGFRIDRTLRRSMRRWNRPLRLIVRRQDQTHTIEVQRKVPTYASIRDEPTADDNRLTGLVKELTALEDAVDDTTVQVFSQEAAEQKVASLGTVVDSAGQILGKSSRVGESPTVVDCRGQSLIARVLARDPDNDLVLLSVSGELPASIDLDSSADAAVGALLLSPRPHDTLGLVSVVGSRPFRSPKQPSAGFLGVMLELRENRVAIRETTEGPARKAGLKPNDIVLKIGDKSIQTVPQMIATIQSYEPGEVVRLMIQRGEQEQDFDITLDRRPDGSRGHVADLFAGGPSLRKTGFESVFCHDAHAEPQECGGPVFDLSGKFVGINVARFSRTRSYALPAQVVRDAVQRMQRQADREAISSDTKEERESSDSTTPERSTAAASQE